MRFCYRKLSTFLMPLLVATVFLLGCESASNHARVTRSVPILPDDTSIWRDRLVIFGVVFDYGVLENSLYVSYKNGSNMICHVRAIHIDGQVDDFYLAPYESTPRQWLAFDSQVGTVSVICENLARD